MAYTVKDITGKTYALEAEINLTEEENGMVIIETEIEPTENNQKFIKKLNEHWTISGIKSVQYGDFHIQHLEKTGIGEWPTLKIEAVADFIYRLQTTTFDGYFTGSRTAVNFFNELSQQCGITIQPVDFKPAFGWEKFGLGVHNISEFNRGLNNYGYTYYPVTPQIIELHDEIGRDVQFMIKNAMNSDSMKMEIDRTEVYTYVEGYADYEEGEGNDNFYKSANLWDEYKHPKLYDLLGELKAETYTNQKINNKDTLHRYLKNIVDNSIKFTITTDFRKIDDYPYAVPMLGDRIRVQDEAIDIDTTARAVKIKTFYDTYGDVIDYEIDFGNFSVSDRVKSTLDEVQSQLEDLISGRNPVGMGMLDAYVGAVIDSIKKSETQIKFGEHLGLNGQFLVDPNDPNDAVGLFSSGIVATENGFAGGIDSNLTITPKGIHADMIRVGTLWLENFLGIIGKSGLLEMNAEQFKMTYAQDNERFLEMNINTGFTISKLPFNLLGKDGRHYFFDGMMRGTPVANLKRFENSAVESDGNRDLLIKNEEFHRVYVVYDQWRANRLDLLINYELTPGSEHSFRYLDVKVVEMYNGNDIYNERINVYREPTGDQNYSRLSIDLKTFFNSIVDYRNLHLYIEVRMLNVLNNVALFRVNKGELYD